MSNRKKICLTLLRLHILKIKSEVGHPKFWDAHAEWIVCISLVKNTII